VMELDRIGKYRVVGRIGQGAMGEVYKAHDPLLNRYVAVKTIAPALAADPSFKTRFQREAQSAAQLNHPNIITIYDFGEEDGLTYMAMELLEGRDLKEVIRGRGTHLGEKLAIMEQMCDGLAFAHTKGVVHRDLKPSNVHLQPNGQVKILDFGLARLGESEMTKTGTVMGTPHYMSPEQVRGEKADARSDVFSLGAVFYELLSGRRAFDAPRVAEILGQILDSNPQPLRERAPEVPGVVAAVVERALAKLPAQRFPDAGALGRALAAARDSMAGETLGGRGGSDLEATVIQPPESALLEPGSRGLRGRVAGATALDLGRGRAERAAEPGTVRPELTLPGPPPTHVPGPGATALDLGGIRARSAGPGAARWSRPVLIGLCGVAVVAVAAGVLWYRARAGAHALPAAEVAQEQVDILTDTLVTSKVELARADLAGHDYEAAARRAEEALKLSPSNADAREVLDQARQAQRQVEAAVAEARAAFSRGDTAAASESLSRVMALDPRQPVIAELSSQLKEHFQRPAEEARTQAANARGAAERARATSQPAFAEGTGLSADAEALFRRQEFTAATQKFLESRDGFERAQREADQARAATARPTPSARPSAVTATIAREVSPPPVGRPDVMSPPAPGANASLGPSNPQPSVAAARSAPPPTVAAVLPPAPASVPPLAASRSEADKLAVQNVIADYKRALESQDIELYRQLYPSLTAEDAKNLRKAFEVVKSMQVGITPESVEVEGDRATVRVTRQDVINGRQTRAVSQTFHFVRSGGGWLIQSIGQ
jgi:tetratricopeptide (TPR) repeat protein